jgi:RNA polymerase sigma-70 factor (ECF subfamily)
MPEQVSDAILLERYVSSREEAAFVALVQRHGPLVKGICRRVLRNEHDAEDVSQATFLVLARKAAGIPWRDSVGGWLGSVAHRLALGARSDHVRLRRRETSFTTLVASNPAPADGFNRGPLPERFHPCSEPSIELERRQLFTLLRDELRQLPEKYRAPVVLCDLNGRTHEEAAEQLGWPAGSMSRRLARARALLRRRLIHRGVSLVIGLLGLTLVFLGARSVVHRDYQTRAVIHQAMTPCQPLCDGVTGDQTMLARVARVSAGSSDPDQVIDLARQVAQIAAGLEGVDPGKNRDQWRGYAVEMRQSALVLAQATQENDPFAMLTAARRLDASCLKCHNVFRQ